VGEGEEGLQRWRGKSWRHRGRLKEDDKGLCGISSDVLVAKLSSRAHDDREEEVMPLVRLEYNEGRSKRTERSYKASKDRKEETKQTMQSMQGRRKRERNQTRTRKGELWPLTEGRTKACEANGSSLLPSAMAARIESSLPRRFGERGAAEAGVAGFDSAGEERWMEEKLMAAGTSLYEG
jgi:hypothetical protein